MLTNQFKELLGKYVANNCTDAEKALVENWYNRTKVENPILLTDEEFASDVDFIQRKLEQTEHHKATVSLWPRIAVAALVLFTLATCLYVYFPGKEKTQNTTQSNYDRMAGTDKAMLTLADGSKISLSDAKAGEIAEQSGLKISKSESGQIIYTAVKGKSSANTVAAQFNTIETPRGGKFQIYLPDGSKVWLDAASSIKYPVEFTGKVRQVELTGQAYFEVAKNKKQSFKVLSGNQELEVLGTHFNISAYASQPGITTTLLEGSVKLRVKNTNTETMLSPGQQSALENKSFDLKDVDTEQAVAWKNGYFMFDSEDVPTVLHTLERWYDVEIHTEGNFDQIKIGGNISRAKNLSEVLRVLQLTRKIKFKQEGRRIIAMP